MTATILVVDDEPDLELLVSQKFRRQIRAGEYRFLFAGDGEEALSVLEEAPEVDLILSDINMPRMDGLTLLGRLPELERELKAVIVSAYGDMANIRTAMNLGAFDFVTKPIAFDDLEVTIKKTLDDLNKLREAYRQREVAVGIAIRVRSDGEMVGQRDLIDAYRIGDLRHLQQAGEIVGEEPRQAGYDDRDLDTGHW